MKRKSVLFILVSLAALAYGFGIFSNSDGYYRRYLTSALPFTYKVHQSASTEWIDAIIAGANHWNYVDGAYMEFFYGGTTFVTASNQDGTNLVFFDSDHINFTPGTSTIAFSRTYTSGTGSFYRAVESDLIWNAADFPPSTTVEPDKQDLESVIVHEFGHHLGLGHAGSVGGPPGVGEDVRDATMWGTSSDGDTTKRSLHIHDIMGVIATYPRWTITGSATDSATGEFVDGAYYYLHGMESARVDPPLFVGDRWQRPGYVITDSVDISPDSSGFLLIPRKAEFQFSVSAYGYDTFDTTFALDTSAVDCVLALHVKMVPSQRHVLNFVLTDSLTGDPVPASLKVYAAGRVDGSVVALDSVRSDSAAMLALPSDSYTIHVNPQLPYRFQIIDGFDLSSDSTITLQINAANVLLVDDDYSDAMPAANQREKVWQNLMWANASAKNFAYRDLFVQPQMLSAADLGLFETVIWFTGINDSHSLPGYSDVLAAYSQTGGNLVLSGALLFDGSAADSTVLHDVFHVTPAGNSTSQILRGEAGDPIGNGNFMGLNVVNAQMMEKDDSGFSSDVFKYLGLKSGVVKYENENKIVVFAFDFGDINNDNAAFLKDYVILERVFDWFSGISGLDELSAATPMEFELYANYPNPFNPETTINFDLPQKGQVELVVYNSIGQKIATLVKGSKPAGRYSYRWDGRNSSGNGVASGVYFYRLSSGKHTAVRKMLLLR